MDSKNVPFAITVKGSVDIICEYLKYGINSILFQRGIYPSSYFQSVVKYGISVMVTEDEKINEFLHNVFQQVEEWLFKKYVTKVSLIVINYKSREVAEIWDFNIEYDDKVKNSDLELNEITSSKPLEKIQHEIRDVIKQIVSAVTFLPLLDCVCCIDLQVHVANDVQLPNSKWDETDAPTVKNPQTVQFRSFSTDIHVMKTFVTFSAPV